MTYTGERELASLIFRPHSGRKSARTREKLSDVAGTRNCTSAPVLPPIRCMENVLQRRRVEEQVAFAVRLDRAYRWITETWSGTD